MGFGRTEPGSNVSGFGLFPSLAQQEAQRAQFLVEKAKQEQKQKIVQAEGEATAAKMISFSCHVGVIGEVGWSTGILGVCLSPQYTYWKPCDGLKADVTCLLSFVPLPWAEHGGCLHWPVILVIGWSLHSQLTLT